ncbi:hypothetical protein OSB04_000873 [Centaurea solstitialis]|uniref:Beta-galactosidase n=1 Tax=Centaurea solstitialis TaxID=347529 RepID=A0AA38WL60_9ASTR|nr:hypothetical protein OSB04_000873 [Centaurea solstitialis]
MCLRVEEEGGGGAHVFTGWKRRKEAAVHMCSPGGGGMSGGAHVFTGWRRRKEAAVHMCSPGGGGWSSVMVEGANVTYDGRSLIIDGQRRILFSGSIHYPRSTPDMWPSLITKAKDGGLDVIQTYVFWNLHEPQPGQSHMQNFTTKIVDMMKAEKLYASQGGPIILSQIENEYTSIEGAFHEDGPRYVNWATEMAVGQNTGEPWVMCKQDDAPDPVINTCNGMRCEETWRGPNSKNKPSLWTENWTSFLQAYGENALMRKSQDLAFHTTLFIIKMNGSFVNYYMYHGGTNFGRTSSSYIITAYYDQAPLDEYGIIRQPKYGHLKDMHAAIKLCSQVLLYGQLTIQPLDQGQDAYVYNTSSGECGAFLVNNGTTESVVVFQNSTYTLPSKSVSILPDCKTVAFNTAMVFVIQSGASATRSIFDNSLPRLEDMFDLVVSTQVGTRLRQPVIMFNSTQQWEEFHEVVPQFDNTTLRSDGLLEQLNTTKDTSDYLWYTTRMQQNSSEAQYMLRANTRGHVLRAYVNGVLVGSAHGYRTVSNFTLESTISLSTGINNISFLSVMVGLPDESQPYIFGYGGRDHGGLTRFKGGWRLLNEETSGCCWIQWVVKDSGAYMESKREGLGEVLIQDVNITSYSWGYQVCHSRKFNYYLNLIKVGLVGEKLSVYDEGSSNVSWSQYSSPSTLTWYKVSLSDLNVPVLFAFAICPELKHYFLLVQQNLVYRMQNFVAFGTCCIQTMFDSPEGEEPIALNLGSMGKGEAWINGQSIGRYWVSFKTNTGSPSQTWYNVPRSFLKSTRNLLVLFEEEYGNPLNISLDTVSINKVCGHISDSHPPPLNSSEPPVLQLRCPHDRNISKIIFASHGNPLGNCQSYSIGNCHSTNSQDMVEKVSISAI